MYFPDKVPGQNISHSEQLKELKRSCTELEREVDKAKKELRTVILIWIGVVALIIIDIIIFTQLL